MIALQHISEYKDYCLPYNKDYIVVCFDERPCLLIGDTIEPIKMESGKENYAYSKDGSCSALAAIEPKTGKRLAHVKEQRTKKEFAIFMLALAKTYPEAIKIKVVLDNLNTHRYSAFHQEFDAETAAWLTEKIEFILHQKVLHGSI